MDIEIKQFVADFLIVNARPELTMQEKLDRSNAERDRAIAIADGVMEWETIQDTRNSMRDLAELKKQINQ